MPPRKQQTLDCDLSTKVEAIINVTLTFMNTLKLGGIALAITFTILAIVYLFVSNIQVAVGAAGELVADAKAATTSQSTLAANTALVLFATSSSCVSRTISTNNSAIKLTFSDNQGAVPTGIVGLLQAASTTVTYDAAEHGCGLVRGISYAAQVVTLKEER